MSDATHRKGSLLLGTGLGVRHHLGRVLGIGLLTTASMAASAEAPDAPAPSAYDGAWWATLHCDDTTDKQGLVKGYDWSFAVRIENGRLEGRYGGDDMPSSVHWVGNVAADGTLEIKADGRSGSNEYTVGRAATGSRYGYTMAGKLDGTRGQATRREVRPCSAVFVKR